MSILYYIGLSGGLYAALTLLFFALSLFIPTAGFPARLLASYASLGACAWYGVIASIILRPFGYQRISQWATARAFKYVMALTTGVTFSISDPNDYLSKTRPAVFICNHQSELDVLVLGWIFPKYCSVTAKKSLKNMPFLGWFMTLSGSVFIDRANSANARHAMAGAAEEIIKHRQSVFMFPEGTRSYSEEPLLLPFKKGAFHLAVQAGVPIVPVVVANYSEVLNLKRWRFNSGRILIKVLKPIETKNLTTADVNDLTRDTRDLMLREITSLTSKTRGHPIAVPAQRSEDGVVKASGAEATITN